jgi:hypothetical protein
MGSGNACDGCDEMISATDPEHEIDETGARYQSVPSRDAARLWW